MDLVTLYVAGLATPEQRAEVEARSVADAGFGRQLEATQLAWQRAPIALGRAVEPPEIDAGWSRLKEAMLDEGEPAPWHRLWRPAAARSSATRRATRLWVPAALAASVLLLLSIPFASLAPRLFGPEMAVREITAARGERLTVRLTDGSRVVLAPGSTLRVRGDYGRYERDVLLTGRAFFDVQPDSARPFLVHAGETVTRVLGTEFVVRAYPENPAVEVLVRSGRVAVQPENLAESVRVLTPGERALMEPARPVRVEPVPDVDALVGWTSGRLSFHREPFRNVVEDLERWFDVEITVTDASTGDRRVTAEFRRGESMDAVLNALGQLLRVDIRRDGDSIIISPAPDRMPSSGGPPAPREVPAEVSIRISGS